MLTTEEKDLLRSLLTREAATAPPSSAATIAAGDLVQLRPGADATWETSLLLVHQVAGDQLRGAIMRPHRGGCREAWAKYSTAEVERVGRVTYAEPAADIRAWCYEPSCPLQLRRPAASERREHPTPREASAIHRGQRAAQQAQLRQETVDQWKTRAKRSTRSPAPAARSAKA